jgi:hypothetical protein
MNRYDLINRVGWLVFRDQCTDYMIPTVDARRAWDSQKNQSGSKRLSVEWQVREVLSAMNELGLNVSEKEL